VSPSITDVIVHAATTDTGTTTTGGAAAVVDDTTTGGAAIDVVDVVDVVAAAVVEVVIGDVDALDRTNVVATAVLGCNVGADVPGTVANDADAGSSSPTAAPRPDPSPPARAPTTATPMTTTPAQPQNGIRRQRRAHHGTDAPGDGTDPGSTGGRGRSLTVDRQCWNRCGWRASDLGEGQRTWARRPGVR
jgi:hypothetical protein